MSMTAGHRRTLTANWLRYKIFRTASTIGTVLTLVCLIATACGGGGSDKPGEKTVVALLPETTDNTFSAAFVARLQQLANENKINLEIYNAKFDAATQATQATSALARRPDALMLWPANPAGARTILLQAQAARIPVQIENSALKASDAPTDLYKTYVGPDNVKIGELQAEMTNAALSGRGRVVMIEGQPANSVNIERSEGYRNRLAQIAPGIEIIASQPGFWQQPKSQSVMAEFLTRFNGMFDAVYTSDDIGAAGAVQAMQAANIPKGRIKVISAGGNKLGLPLVEEGWVYGTAFQSPIQEADLAIPSLIKIMNGQTVERHQYVDIPQVTAANVEQFTPEW